MTALALRSAEQVHRSIGGVGRHRREVRVAAAAAGEELAPDLGRHLWVRLRAQQVAQRLLLLGGHLGLVVLREREEGLLPKQRRRVLRGVEGKEVLDEGVDDAIRQGVPARGPRGSRSRRDLRLIWGVSRTS